MYLNTLSLNNPYHLIHTIVHSTVTAGRSLSVLRIRSVRLGTVVKETQMPASFLSPRHPQSTKNYKLQKFIPALTGRWNNYRSVTTGLFTERPYFSVPSTPHPDSLLHIDSPYTQTLSFQTFHLVIRPLMGFKYSVNVFILTFQFSEA